MNDPRQKSLITLSPHTILRCYVNWEYCNPSLCGFPEFWLSQWNRNFIAPQLMNIEFPIPNSSWSNLWKWLGKERFFWMSLFRILGARRQRALLPRTTGVGLQGSFVLLLLQTATAPPMLNLRTSVEYLALWIPLLTWPLCQKEGTHVKTEYLGARPGPTACKKSETTTHWFIVFGQLWPANSIRSSHPNWIKMAELN